MAQATTISTAVTYPPEPEQYDRAMVVQHYANFSGPDALRHLIGWRHEWEKRLRETSGHWHARPRLCQMHLEVVTAEIERRDKQLTVF